MAESRYSIDEPVYPQQVVDPGYMTQSMSLPERGQALVISKGKATGQLVAPVQNLLNALGLYTEKVQKPWESSMRSGPLKAIPAAYDDLKGLSKYVIDAADEGSQKLYDEGYPIAGAISYYIPAF